MVLKNQFDKSDIQKQFAQVLERFDRAIESRFRLIGEQFVKDARNSGDYLDQTGNLRSSIGYLILKHGQVMQENFQKSGKGNDRATGVSKGETFASELALQYPSGYVLIVVAGMGYAAAVESKGRDVLTASSYAAETSLRLAIQKLKGKI